MIGILSIAFAVVAAYRFYGTSSTVLFAVSIGGAAIAFWLVGVSHNFAMEAAKRRRSRDLENWEVEGRPRDEIRRLASERIRIRPGDERSIPNGLSSLHMLVTLANIALLIASFVMK